MKNNVARQRLEAGGATQLTEHSSAAEAVEDLIATYENNVGTLREAAGALRNGIEPREVKVTKANYPLIAFAIGGAKPRVRSSASWGFCRMGEGVYASSITQPRLFRQYLLENIGAVMRAHNAVPIVGLSPTTIPAPFALEGVGVPASVSERFSWPNVVEIADDSNGEFGCFPLAQFSARLVDYRLNRLPHYTGTAVADFQRLVLLTNYRSYVESFRKWAMSEERKGEGYTGFVEPLLVEEDSPVWHGPQMPAYHLQRPDGLGVTLVNIGVGPSNAWNLMENISALRPDVAIMVGHCAGLRNTQEKGRFVLGEGFLRCDPTGESVLPLHVPIPPIGEVNSALRNAVKRVKSLSRREVKRILESGVIASVSNRLWEITPKDLQYILEARCAAVDMESAVIAACGFARRVPYGSFLCVSDLPLHGDLKAAATAVEFYNGTVDSHLAMALEALNLLRAGNIERLHSRKLRSTRDPAFR